MQRYRAMTPYCMRHRLFGVLAAVSLTLWVASASAVDSQAGRTPSSDPRSTPHPDSRVNPTVADDPVLTQLIAQSLAARPKIAGARAVVQAERERISQVGALPDPMLQVGIQNDGFTSIEIGRMPTSYYSIMAAQTFPWPGKRGL